MKKFINFIKNNALLILAAYWLIDAVFCLFTCKVADNTTGWIKPLTIGLDLLWTVVFFEIWVTAKIEKLLNKRITLVSEEVDFMYDTIRKAVEESNKENKEESADKEEKEVN